MRQKRELYNQPHCYRNTWALTPCPVFLSSSQQFKIRIYSLLPQILLFLSQLNFHPLQHLKTVGEHGKILNQYRVSCLSLQSSLRLVAKECERATNLPMNNYSGLTSTLSRSKMSSYSFNASCTHPPTANKAL